MREANGPVEMSALTLPSGGKAPWGALGCRPSAVQEPEDHKRYQESIQEIFETVEITGLTTIDGQQPMWRETTLLTGRAVQFATAQTYFFSDPVLCLGSVSDEPVKAWESRIKWFLETRYLKDLDNIDGEPMEFEWKISPGFTTFGILTEIQNMTTESKCEPEQCKGRIIFMSVYNDI